MTPVSSNKKLDPSGAGSPSETETNVTHIWDTIISRTYEDPYKWYLVVFSPINRAYTKDPDYFRIKGLSKCRDMFKKPQAIILTREVLDCEKIHINALVCTDQDVLRRNTRIYCNKYYVHVQQLDRSHLTKSRVLKYIVKEQKKRALYKYLDYIHYDKNSIMNESEASPIVTQAANAAFTK